MKEQILQKFEDKYYYKYTLNGDVIPAFEMNVYLLKDIKQFISQAIDQTREETIREVEEIKEKAWKYDQLCK